LIPLGSAGAAAGSLASFPNRSPRVRLMKKLLAAALKMGIGRPLLDRVFVECAEPPPVSGLISTVTGEARPVFALLPGPPGPYRKVVVQAMRPGGETLGYLKIPLSPAAEERVRREERALRRLEEAPGLRTRVPRVLHAGSLRGSHVLFLSPGVGRSGPARWTPMHDEFFRILGGIRPARRDGPSLIAEVAERWRKAVGDDGEWSAIASRALKQAGEALSGIEVPCGVTHGDFSAEHTILQDGKLFVLDWEQSREGAPVWWDYFHFHVRLGGAVPFRGLPGERACHLLYLLDALAGYLEVSRRDHEEIARLRSRLAEGLSEPPAASSTRRP